ncbi:hypothetical protein DXT76_13485 [Halobacillus trueperi]|uniref:Uncharacterized protein n=1 Tax=Halobacillus trueperi TaxID=156205 RepID=A0A3D8VLV2_9BACI|nr:hypothetical protein [Halobacillus trueperi]RDY70282.1 hypothetical protein DXT76_13485 [Halobacillus trueperi]
MSKRQSPAPAVTDAGNNKIDLTKVTQIREIDFAKYEEANELLDQGWALHDIYTKKEGPKFLLLRF